MALLREASAERVDSVAGQWLTAIDDTAPAVRLVSALGALQSLVLEADEPLSAQGFSVVKVFKDYDTHAQPSEDISSRFNPIVSQGNRLELRLRSDAVLEANALYQVTLTGVRDVANNPARDNGVTLAGTYSGSYQAEDRLAPRQDSLQVLLQGQPLTAATQLKLGSRYALSVSAVDNVQASDKLGFSYRVSADGGQTWKTDWIAIQKGQFNLDIQGDYQGFALLLRASDGRNTSERRFDAQVSAPDLTLGQFSTLPTPVEELSLIHI